MADTARSSKRIIMLATDAQMRLLQDRLDCRKCKRCRERDAVLCLPLIKPGHIGDAVHPGSDETERIPLPRRP
jgi:hypothetical protein